MCIWTGWGWSATASVTVPAPPATGTMPSDSGEARPAPRHSGYFNCQNASRPSTVGITAKLYSGGGEDVAHSRVAPSQGSQEASFP